MKRFIIIFFYFICTYLQGQIFEEAPFPSAYNKYIKNKASGEIVPAPFVLNFSNERTSFKNSYPERFDLRDSSFITSVKNQGACGCCWAFATLGSLESQMLMKGNGVYDFSEENMKNCHGFLMPGCSNGNHHVSVAYLSRGSGPALEIEEPYVPVDNICSGSYSPQYIVTGSFDLPNDRDVIKNTVMNYGGVYATIYWHSSFYNSTYKTYCYTGASEVNHAVLITGWDDNKVIAGKSGAWIAKNSWGTSFGESGYFYISYFDTKFLSAACVFSSYESKSNVNAIYLHDSLGMVGSLGYGSNTAYGLVKFTTTSMHSIHKIGTFINTQNSKISIEVFSAKEGDILLNRLAFTDEFLCSYPGYYTFDLPKKIVFNKGENFYVKVKYVTPGYNYPVPCEYFIADYSDPHIKDNTSWVSSNAAYWEQMGSSVSGKAKDVCIRAYATLDTTFTNSDFIIYPNPNQGIFTIEFGSLSGNIKVALHDLQGRKIYERSFEKKTNQKIQRFNFSGLPKGIYILSINSNGSIYKKKVVIE